MHEAPHVLMVANWDWVIYNFRLVLAKALRDEGYSVTFVCPDGKYRQRLQEEGFRWREWRLERRSLNPLAEVKAIGALADLYAQEQPDLIHHDTIKPNVYGALATWINQKRGARLHPPQLINSFMGIGFLFSDRTLARVLRPFVLPIMRFGMRRDHILTTFSNQGDRATFVKMSIVRPDQSREIVSEFVNTERFAPASSEENTDEPLSDVLPKRDDEVPLRVLMAARLLWDKGVKEFAEASRILASRGLSVEFCLAGEPDTQTPGYVPEETLRAWEAEGHIHWLGYCSDMPELLRRVDVGVLPTHYNEGMPRFLVEAAASGLPLVTTDLEACRRVVVHEDNGFIIPTRNAHRLADAIATLAQNKTQRKAMGAASRARVLERFSEQKALAEWRELYSRKRAAAAANGRS